MRIEKVSSKNFGIQFNYDLEIVEWIKTIPGSHFDGDRKMWIVPLMFGAEVTRKMQIPSTYIDEDIYADFRELEYKPNHKGFILKSNLDADVLQKELGDKYIFLKGDLFGNHNTKRSKKMLEDYRHATNLIFVLEEIPPKNESMKMFAILKALNHKYGFWTAWYQKRFCIFEKGRFGIQFKGFNNKEEFYTGIKDIMINIEDLVNSDVYKNII